MDKRLIEEKMQYKKINKVVISDNDMFIYLDDGTVWNIMGDSDKGGTDYIAVQEMSVILNEN